jgi:hypothetical protein
MICRTSTFSLGLVHQVRAHSRRHENVTRTITLAIAHDKSTQFEPIFLQHVLDLIGKHKEVLFLQPAASEIRVAVKLLILETPPMETCEVARPALSRPASTAPSLGSPLPLGVLHAQPRPCPAAAGTGGARR